MSNSEEFEEFVIGRRLFQHNEEMSGGMTLRDYFAAKAMQGMSSRGGYSEWAHMAEDAYDIADAMLEARK